MKKNLHGLSVILLIVFLCHLFFFSFFYSMGSSSEDLRCDNISSKSQWVQEAFADITSGNYPKLAAISYWSEKWENNFGYPSDLRVNSSPSALDAYLEGIKKGSFTFSPLFSYSDEKGYILSPTNHSLYVSAFPDLGNTEDIVTRDRILSYEQVVTHSLVWVYFSNHWGNKITFPQENVSLIRSLGCIPFIRLMPWTDIGEEYKMEYNYTLQRIIDGEFDQELIQWAIAANNSGGPLILEFGVEVNGDWFPWNGAYCGAGVCDKYGDPSYPDGPERFRDAYRHIISLFRSLQVKNVTWFFHYNDESEPDEWWNSPLYYYPGDSYIDWIGVSIYGPQSWKEDWSCFHEKMNTSYELFYNLSHTKPFAILEFSADENGGRALTVYSLIASCFLIACLPFVALLKWFRRSSSS